MVSEENFDNSASCDVAIIGLAGRFPGARDVEEFWENLKNGVEGISFFADDELEDSRELLNPNLVKARGTLTDVELFDAPFFSIPTREAQMMDPQQRLFLEAAWTALEDAGYDASTYAGQIAVYAGVSTNTYLLTRMAQLGMNSPADHYSIILANEKDYLATRVSYKLNLRGESITIQTSCSTSLVAVHLACQSLLSGQCDMALAGGVSVGFPQKTGYFYQEGMILSPDGHCRPFDHKAQGIVPGHGLGVVVLKLLSEAIADGDNVRAVIKGSAINNDGHLKMGYTAPSLEGQTDVIVKALAMAGVDPETVTFVEAHGTGTPIGDPIEVEALTRAFRRGGQTQRNGFCALGAVKSNIGHLDSAAGVAGLIKTVLALEHKQIPPTLHFEKPNPIIDFANSPFTVNASLVDWPANGTPRRAGVSSFGIGGTNAHLVVEEAPAASSATTTSREFQLLTLSAKTPSALAAMAEKLAQHFERRPDINLADAAYTLNVGRQAFPHRRSVVARDRDEAITALRRAETATRKATEQTRVVFMFPGQGALSVGMARTIYQHEREFQKQFDECAAWLRQQHDIDLPSFVHADDAERAAQLLAGPQFALPALFTVEYALAKLWLSWGINPHAMIGHSFGEYVAACLAGVFTLRDALSLVVTRGRLMQQLPPGAMSAVRLGAAELEPYLDGDVSISAVNSPNICTITGPTEQVEKLERVLSENRVAFQRLDVPYAYHSAMVEAILPEFAAAVSRIGMQAPAIPYISNLTGTWVDPDDVVTPTYWTRQMRQTVRFAPGVETLIGSGHTAFVEIGSGQTLSPLLKSYVKRDGGHIVVPSLSHSPAVSDEAVMFKSLGQLWQAGVAVDWSGFFHAERRRRISLPAYPFERQRYWIETPRPEEIAQTAVANTVDVLPEAVIATPQPNGHASVALNDVEARLAGIWSDVLGQTSIDLDDSFFDLGGDSLLATQVHARLKQAFPVNISLQQLFEHQTLRQLSDLIQQASESDTATSAAYQPVQRVSRDQHLPLSFAQEWFWLLDQLQPGSAAYNLPAAVRLEGPLDVAALHRSFNEIVRRHEILRTSFRIIDGQPTQIIAPAEPLGFPIVDLEHIPPSEREKMAQELTVAEVSRPFDLSTSPMIRTVLLRLGEQDHIALCTVHHIAFDAWSGGVLMKELSALYDAFSNGRPSPLAELPIQYADYASWQREFLQGEVLEEQLSYWKNQLAGAPPLLNLPTDRPRPPVPSYRGARESFSLPVELAASLRELSRREGVTMFMLLLAAFQTLLGRYSKQDDVSVGMSIAGRNRVEFEGLIGCFLNTLVLRTQLAPNLRFRELLQRVRETTLQAYAHQELPLEKLMEVLKPERNAGYMPLYQVLLDVINTPGRAVETPGQLTLTPMESDTASAKLDLLMDVWESGDQLGGLVEYKTDLFDRETIVKLIGHFETMLDSIVADPDTRLSSLEMRTEAEVQQELTAQAERAAARHQKFINLKPKAVVP